MGCSSSERGRIETAKCRFYTAAQRAFSAHDLAGKVVAGVERSEQDPPLVVTCVYRHRNSKVVQELVEPVRERSDVRLWALDQRSPQLERWTAGDGPGGRLELHQTMLGRSPVHPASTWLLIDDDFRFVHGSLLALAKVAVRARLDVFGATHCADSNFNHLITIQRPGLVVRDTSFVEIGPVVGLSAAARARLLPFADPAGLSWGMEAVWARARDDGLRLGLVDALPINHLGVVGADYDKAPENDRAEALLRSLGYRTLFDLFKVHGRWWSWQAEPPWVQEKTAPPAQGAA